MRRRRGARNPNKRREHPGLGYKDIQPEVRIHKRVLAIIESLPQDVIEAESGYSVAHQDFSLTLARHVLSDLTATLGQTSKRWERRYRQTILPWAMKTLYNGVHPEYIPVLDMSPVKLTLDSGNYDPIRQALNWRWSTEEDEASDIVRIALECWFFGAQRLQIECQVSDLGF